MLCCVLWSASCCVLCVGVVSCRVLCIGVVSCIVYCVLVLCRVVLCIVVSVADAKVEQWELYSISVSCDLVV